MTELKGVERNVKGAVHLLSVQSVPVRVDNAAVTEQWTYPNEAILKLSRMVILEQRGPHVVA